MTIAQTATTSFKVQLLQAQHNFGPTSADTFKIALYTANANIDASTTVYTTDGEVVGNGYVAGGKVLTVNPTPTFGTNFAGVTTAFLSFVNVEWEFATFTARGALIYNFSNGNKSVAVLDFGADKQVGGDSFQIIFPEPDANSAIVRIS
jgi:hypothetical protein